MSTSSRGHVVDLTAEPSPPSSGILSRTIHEDEQVKAVVFDFDAGQELSEHTASRPAILQIVRGEAALTLGPEVIDGVPGTWVHMPAGLNHAIKARTPLTMLLLLLKS